ncbi:hypothetical protein J421_5109 (plasmid) [Gemmatirosa kalamazoonensis]|uniref:DUF3828 domain-containing protein n=1 Tax=Gemmatirosa kalamazoonensis TaxID=861299 RepID=W0RNR6_9BACT|nr:hypothetical protein [Gemmatirosa kalamazoonensis]AHG92644.1 hypothetical protein J421_5109 [Gemmatirosa kalamazoonensis]
MTLGGLQAAAQPSRDATADSVGRVVQAFYTWYTPLATASGAGPAWMRAIHERRTLFAPAIVAALRRDSVASARSPDEVVGLDGDPFLNAQDPCEHYVVRRARRAGDRFLVDVVGEGGCARHTRADVVVEVMRGASGWRLENFRYPDPPTDLLAMLRRLHQR